MPEPQRRDPSASQRSLAVIQEGIHESRIVGRRKETICWSAKERVLVFNMPPVKNKALAARLQRAAQPASQHGDSMSHNAWHCKRVRASSSPPVVGGTQLADQVKFKFCMYHDVLRMRQLQPLFTLLLFCPRLWRSWLVWWRQRFGACPAPQQTHSLAGVPISLRFGSQVRLGL